ncbi:MAG: hypothetical protein ACNYPI_00320 [Arenicellales bacterium WSBS_2016_MAG_OTU3]
MKQDYKEAVYWYEQAAQQGYAKAQDNLGYMRKGERCGTGLQNRRAVVQQSSRTGICQSYNTASA